MIQNRREFIARLAAGTALLATPFELIVSGCSAPPPRTIRIRKADSNFEREPLIRPFGFKGGYMFEIWQ